MWPRKKILSRHTIKGKASQLSDSGWCGEGGRVLGTLWMALSLLLWAGRTGMPWLLPHLQCCPWKSQNLVHKVDCENKIPLSTSLALAVACAWVFLQASFCFLFAQSFPATCTENRLTQVTESKFIYAIRLYFQQRHTLSVLFCSTQPLFCLFSFQICNLKIRVNDSYCSSTPDSFHTMCLGTSVDRRSWKWLCGAQPGSRVKDRSRKAS